MCSYRTVWVAVVGVDFSTASNIATRIGTNHDSALRIDDGNAYFRVSHWAGKPKSITNESSIEAN